MTNFEPFKMVTTINLTKGVIPKTAILLVVSGFLLYSCKNDKQEGILSQKEFASLLVEFYVAEARLNTSPIVRDSAIRLFIPLEQAYLDKHRISNEILTNTYRYYLDHPDEFGRIYDSVIDTLSLREQRTMVLH
jgi:Domain of unknown function (DUF4296)